MKGKAPEPGKPAVRFSILSAAPESLAGYADASVLGRARRDGLIAVDVVPLRDFADPPHRVIDDKPFGGGPGMVLKVEPIVRALRSVRPRKSASARVILFSTRGTPFTQAEAERLARYRHLVLICGRYEGVDERVALHVADEEISLGGFVLTGGELPALAVVDAVSRLVPGVLGTYGSLEGINGSFTTYTRPESFSPGRGKASWDVPKVLVSGDHKAIAAWRRSDGSGGTR